MGALSRMAGLPLIAATAFFMQALDMTILNTALPAIARSLHHSPLAMQSAVISYTLTVALFIPVSGWLADHFGTRRVFVSAVGLFVLGSLACAASPSLPALVAARCVQGVGGAMMMPVARLAVLRGFPRDELVAVLNFITIPGLVGPVVGPLLGGWLVTYATWHWIFLINVPVGLAGCMATLRFMPQVQGPPAGRFDAAGYGLLAFGMVALSLGLDGLSGLGMGQAAVLLLMVFGFASVAAYWLHAARVPQPLFSPRLFAQPSLRIGLLGNLFARLGSGSMPFLVPLLLQVSMGYSPLQAGMMMLPVAVAGMGAKPLAMWLIDRMGYRRVLVGNTLAVGVVMASFALTSPDHPWALRVAQLALFGAVNSLQFTAMNTVTLKDLAPDMASSGNSLLSMVQMLAMGMGVAAAGAVLGAFTALWGAAAGQTLPAFHATFACMGLMTMAAAGIFAQLAPDGPADGPSQAG